MEEVSGMGITIDETNIDLGQGGLDSMMRLSLIFSSLGFLLFTVLSTFNQFALCVQMFSSLAARFVRFNIIRAGAVEKFRS
jgi:hypothetical protein